MEKLGSLSSVGSVGNAASAAMVDAKVTLSRMARAAAGEALRPSQGESSAAVSGTFGAALRNAMSQVSTTQVQADSLQRQFQLGDPRVGLEETVIASQQASLAFQAALQVRNRVTQAYQEIMQMNV